jgi:hypothetical protein
MGDSEITTAVPNDGFEQYYTEKLWSWIPEVYRHEDGLGQPPGVLRALIEVLAGQAAVARRSIDRLWEDQYIELCDDWAVPYIGDLVGTRLVHELNRRGRRADVAKTIYYRRRKGTPALMETLVRDMTGWEGVAVEGFQRLSRTRHKLDLQPNRLLGPVTGMSPGGWARLRSTRGMALTGGPFDDLAHTPDVRQLRGRRGRWNIPKLNFHLFRLTSYEVSAPTPYGIGTAEGRGFTFDPSGRDVSLFIPAGRPAASDWHPPRPWELPQPLECRLLAAAQFVMTSSLIQGLGLSDTTTAELMRYAGDRFVSEARLQATLETLGGWAEIQPVFGTIVEGAMTVDSPKTNIYPSAVAVALAGTTIERAEVAAGDLSEWDSSAWLTDSDGIVAIDPRRGRFWLPASSTGVVSVPWIHYGFSGEVGAGTYDRRSSILEEDVTLLPDGDPAPGPIALAMPPEGAHELVNSKTYEPDDDVVLGSTPLWLQAANYQRPYVVRRVSEGLDLDWIFTGGTAEDGKELTLEGLWLGIEEVGADPVNAPIEARLVLDGNFDKVTIRHCTLDPGGEKARLDPESVTYQAVPVVKLVVTGTVEELVVDASIVGSIVEDGGEIISLSVTDSIIQSLKESTPALQTGLGHVTLKRVTVLGDINVNRLYASELFLDGDISVADNQRSCLRFSAIPEGAVGAHGIRRVRVTEMEAPWRMLVSRRFGDPGYCQLAEAAPEEIRRGAENRSEVGAFSSLLNPIKLADLKAKVAEYAPFGLVAQYINER